MRTLQAIERGRDGARPSCRRVPDPVGGTTAVSSDLQPDRETGRDSVRATVRAGALVLVLLLVGRQATLGAQCLPAFQRGDSNLDERVNISDPVATLGYLFLGAGAVGCLDAADADDDGKIDLGDAVFTVGYLFLGGVAIPPPILGRCGLDPTPDALDCAGYPACGIPGDVRCTTGDCCPPGFYCEKEVGDCEGIGACAPIPDVCPLFFDPVCGCDGETYGNACEAAGAGVSIAFKGPCDRPPGCFGNEDCEPDAYCERPAGACADPGACATRPVGCDKVFDPVCGCDGVTYGNDCEAASSGVSIEHRGECLVGEECRSNNDCDPDQYCVKKTGRCDDVGICGRRPALCVDVFDPVCGCDGVTYDNLCFAGHEGVNISSFGPCDGGGFCASNEDCSEEAFCYTPEGLCNDPGFCRVRPPFEACADQGFAPVCGCDGLTYENACQALSRGVSIGRRGPCEAGAECLSAEDCADGYYCVLKEGLCQGPGYCSTRPMEGECAGFPDDPVCGCDNLTYRTECDAAAAGVSIAYRGPCDDLPHCLSNDECEEGQYCAFREGFCGGLGVCTDMPVECPEDLIDPVCGCDQVTYLNECSAARRGVSVAFRGKCDGGNVGCQTNAACGGGSYCDKDDGDCDGLGECQSRPLNCPDTLDPACGCDGITYDNPCRAHAEGVNVLHAGECE